MNTRSPRLFLMPAGATALAAFFMVVHAKNTAEPYDPFGTSRFYWTALFLGVFLVASYALGLPDVPQTRAAAAIGSATAVLSSVAFVSLAQLGLGVPLLPRMVVGGLSLVYVPWVMLCWRVQTDVDSLRSARIFAVAEPDEVAALRTDLVDDVERPAEIVGWMSPADARSAGPGTTPLVDAVVAAKAEFLIMDVSSQAETEIVHQAAALHSAGIRIRTLSLFTEEFLGKIPLAEMERVSLLFDIGEVHRIRYVRTKRIFDVAFALLGMVGLVFITPALAVANFFGNRGPLFYSQSRVGKNGRDFQIYKFRSMTPSSGPTTWTDTDDARVTSIGAVLRKSHVDELPQLWNILRGDLSIVGPRPEQRMYVDQLVDKLPYYDVRHLVRPGLTGWAQTKYGYGSDDDDAREKLQYDLFYLRRQSLALDIRIVVRTLRTLVLSRGR